MGSQKSESIASLLSPEKPGLAILIHHFCRLLQDYANFYMTYFNWLRIGTWTMEWNLDLLQYIVEQGKLYNNDKDHT